MPATAQNAFGFYELPVKTYADMESQAEDGSYMSVSNLKKYFIAFDFANVNFLTGDTLQTILCRKSDSGVRTSAGSKCGFFLLRRCDQRGETEGKCKDGNEEEAGSKSKRGRNARGNSRDK